MFTSLESFLKSWEYESGGTRKMIAALTDASLTRPATPQDRTLGRIAWHLAQTIPEMLARTGLKIDGPTHDAAVPAQASAVLAAYEQAAASAARVIRESWTDAALLVEDDMYGERWKRGFTLACLILHQAHHRGQMTVLMRQAGLAVPGVYGPAREEWAAFGQPAPAI